MKRIVISALLAMSAVAYAQQPWQKQPEPEMSKAAPNQVQQAIAKMPDATYKKVAAKKVKKYDPQLGMTKQQVLNSSWGAPVVKKRTINHDGTWDQWGYCGDHWLTFLDGELYEIEINE